MSLNRERWSIILGALLGLAPLLNIVNTADFGLEILSIIFGGLMATAAIIHSSWDSNTLKRLRITGHDKYLLEYITIPIYVDFALLVLQLFGKLFRLPIPQEYSGQTALFFSVVNFLSNP